MAEDMRADIEAALGDTDDGVTQDTTVDTPVDTSPAPAADAPAPTEGDKVRDALGRFVNKAGDTVPAAASSGGTPAQAQPGLDGMSAAPAIAAAPTAQAPTSWGPAVREHWATLPPAVQEQVAQREHQFQQAFREAAPLRNAGEAFLQAVQPFQHAIQAEGVDPITAVRNLMQIGTTLRFGTPAEKAATVARMVKAYGIGIEDLDGALIGEVPQGGQQGLDPNYVQNLVQQQLAPLYQAAQQRQQAMQQEVASATQVEMDAFAAKHEYFGDVRGLMADMIEVAERNGLPMGLDDAYKRACGLHPEVSRVMLARQQGAAAQKLTANARIARSAAVSVKGGAPVGNPARAEPTSIRESVEAAIEHLTG
jgi:hypothetical protein